MALKLNRDDTINLIRIYGEYECLWNCRKKVYSNHLLKKEAWETIANYFDSDVAEIKKKIKYLRTAYVAERRKLEESKRNTTNSSELYQPKLFYYNDFNYLDNTIVLRKRELTDNDYEADDEELLPKKEISYDELSTDTNERLQENESVWEKCTPEDYLEEDFQQPQFKKVKLGSQFSTNTPASTNDFEHCLNDGIQKPSNNSSGDEDMYLAFGKSVGLQLRHLKSVNAAKAMAQIQEILTKFAVSEA